MNVLDLIRRQIQRKEAIKIAQNTQLRILTYRGSYYVKQLRPF